MQLFCNTCVSFATRGDIVHRVPDLIVQLVHLRFDAFAFGNLSHTVL